MSAAHNRRVRILVVDDDAAVRRSLATALGRDGYDVVSADDGRAALAHTSLAGVDAIVLDVAMPEPNGLEVCRRLRSRGNRTPILMLTARDLIDDRVAGLDAGADDYLIKPFALRSCGPGFGLCCVATGRAPSSSATPTWCSTSRGRG